VGRQESLPPRGGAAAVSVTSGDRVGPAACKSSGHLLATTSCYAPYHVTVRNIDKHR
jgi:hypothetical protein